MPAGRTRFDLGRVLERRRAHRELEAILGVRVRPVIASTYGLAQDTQEALERYFGGRHGW